MAASSLQTCDTLLKCFYVCEYCCQKAEMQRTETVSRVVGRSKKKKKLKENCRHASAETSKAFSLQGKYLKANIQLTLLLLQTPASSPCSIQACRVAQRRTDRCLEKNIFLYSQQDVFWRKRSLTCTGWGWGAVIRDRLKSWYLLANSLALDGVPLLCRGSKQLAVSALISHFPFSVILFFFF